MPGWAFQGPEKLCKIIQILIKMDDRRQATTQTEQMTDEEKQEQ